MHNDRITVASITALEMHSNSAVVQKMHNTCSVADDKGSPVMCWVQVRMNLAILGMLTSCVVGFLEAFKRV